MKKTLFMVALLSLFINVHANDLVWQLGRKNGFAKEFSPQYRAWEYGEAPAIRNSPAMDHSAHTFNYVIKENKLIPRPNIVSGLATESERYWMKEDELVSGLKLTWNEKAMGNRKLELEFVDWKNYGRGRTGKGLFVNQEDIEVFLPDGTMRIFKLPDGKLNKGKNISFSAVCSVKPGENTITIRIKSMAKHYMFHFDYIALIMTKAQTDAQPILKSHFDQPNGIYQHGQDVYLTLDAYNIAGRNDRINYTVEDVFGKKIMSDQIELNKPTVTLKLPSNIKGWFKVEARSGKAVAANSYVVLEPVEKEYINDSRFGCHSIRGDGYRLRYWPEIQEQQMRNAYLAGAKWTRYHRLSWNVIEPRKGEFNWEFIDRKLAVAEKYKIRTVFNLGDIAKWASSKPNETKLSVTGVQAFTQYPPEKQTDWYDFVFNLVSHYKNRVKWYELWNEPGYSSAFWLDGSPEKYGALMKTAYEAAKKADPSCITLSGAPLNGNESFFENAVKSTGGKLYFDVMSLHYLGNEAPESIRLEKWKTLLKKLGGSSIPIVNSEDMHWDDDGTLPGVPSSLIKLHVREAAKGIKKTFVFNFFCNQSYVSAFDPTGAPRPRYAAYRTMTHRLEYADFAAVMSLGETEAYLFDRKGTPVIVLWSSDESSLELPYGDAPAKIIDIMDVESTLQTSNGKLKVKTSKVPVFVEGGDLKILKAYAEVIQSLPHNIVTNPGKTIQRNVEQNRLLEGLKLQVPEKWKGNISESQLSISVPSKVSSGIYDVGISMIFNGISFVYTVPVEVNNGIIGENLIRNGNFSKGNAYWFLPKKSVTLTEDSGINVVRTKGKVFFGCSGHIKVRKGEKYVLITEARGEGSFGGVISIDDKSGEKIFPKKAEINCLRGKVDPEWKMYYEEFPVNQNGAASLKFSILANYGDKTGKEIQFKRFAIVRLTDRVTLNKAVFQGTCARASGMPSDWSEIPAMMVESAEYVVPFEKAKWTGSVDLSASCQLAIDKKFLYMRFSVKDDVHKAADTLSHGWKYDSIQFAIDPAMDGKDRTEIIIAHDSTGKVGAYKCANYWTPELPGNLTRQGLVPDVKVTTDRKGGKMIYTVQVPLCELYPFNVKKSEFGFSWLVNDNDGHGRKYIQWSCGIGPSKNPKLFGLVRIK